MQPTSRTTGSSSRAAVPASPGAAEPEAGAAASEGCGSTKLLQCVLSAAAGAPSGCWPCSGPPSAGCVSL